jgi:hypothetical protein
LPPSGTNNPIRFRSLALLLVAGVACSPAVGGRPGWLSLERLDLEAVARLEAASKKAVAASLEGAFKV